MSQHDDLFHELSRTLDVSPSRDFADGVRSRIARRRLIMRTTMSGLAIAASVLLVVVVRQPAPIAVAELVSVPPAPVVVTSSAPTVPVTPAVPRESGVVTSRRRVALQEAVEPDRLQVVTNQMAVLQAVWAGHRVTAEETEAPAVDVSVPADPMPVVVEPVRVLPVVIVDRRPRTEGLPIIRRAVAALETK